MPVRVPTVAGARGFHDCVGLRRIDLQRLRTPTWRTREKPFLRYSLTTSLPDAILLNRLLERLSVKIENTSREVRSKGGRCFHSVNIAFGSDGKAAGSKVKESPPKQAQVNYCVFVKDVKY